MRGEDYLLDNCLHIINLIYNMKKCNFTYGNNSKFINYNNWLIQHPRTFKLDSIKYIEESDFKFKNKWLESYSSKNYINKLLKIYNKDVYYIKKEIYKYVDHEYNYKIIHIKEKNEIINYTNNLAQNINVKNVKNEIHIAICIKKLKDIENLQKLLKLNDDEYIFIYHVISNINISEYINNKQNIHIYYGLSCKLIYTKYKYIKNIILKKYNVNYIIILNDINLNDKYQILNIWKLKKNRTLSGYNIYDINDKLKDIKTSNFVIDISIFNENILNAPLDLDSNINFKNNDSYHLWISYLLYLYKYNFNIISSIKKENKEPYNQYFLNYINNCDNNTIDNNTIDDNTIDNNTIDNNTIDDNTIDDNTIDNNTIDSNTIDNNTIDDNTIDNNTIDNNTIDSKKNKIIDKMKNKILNISKLYKDNIIYIYSINNNTIIIKKSNTLLFFSENKNYDIYINKKDKIEIIKGFFIEGITLTSIKL